MPGGHLNRSSKKRGKKRSPSKAAQKKRMPIPIDSREKTSMRKLRNDKGPPSRLCIKKAWIGGSAEKERACASSAGGSKKRGRGGRRPQIRWKRGTIEVKATFPKFLCAENASLS